MDRPPTSYAWNDGTALAYQVVGTSGPDLLLVPGSVSHLEVLWEEPRVHRFLRRFAAFCRLIIMDPRGLGLSDRLSEIPTMEERVGDLLSVLDAAESERATLFGNADSGPACIAAAVSHPERVERLILCGTYAKASRGDDYPWGWTDEEWADFGRSVRDHWGTVVREDTIPSMAGDQAFLQWTASLMRLGASPRAVLLLAEMTMSVDVRSLLDQVSVPTLVMHRIGDRIIEAENGRYLAERIPGARWVDLPGDDFLLWAGDTDAIVDEVEEFLTGRRGAAEPARVVATVMFTDVAGSTERAHELGDRAWADLLRSRTTSGSAPSCAGTAAARSTRQATASSRPSTLPPRRSRAHGRCTGPFARSGSTCGSACTRASAKSSETGSEASPSTPAHGSCRRPEPARSSCRRR